MTNRSQTILDYRDASASAPIVLGDVVTGVTVEARLVIPHTDARVSSGVG